MGVYIDWDISVKPVTPEQEDELDLALDWWTYDGYTDGDTYRSTFYTESINACDDIEQMMREFTERYPDTIAEVYLKGDCDECPDKWLFQKGKMRTFVGSVFYTETTKKEDTV